MPPSSSPLNPDPHLDIRDPAIDVTALQAAVAAGLAQRRDLWAGLERHWPAFGQVSPPPPPDPALPPAPALFYHLEEANRLARELAVAGDQRPSRATRIPVAGPIWRQVRAGAHQLALFYVNKLGARQAEVNHHLVLTLNELVRENQALQRQVQALTARLADLERPADR